MFCIILYVIYFADNSLNSIYVGKITVFRRVRTFDAGYCNDNNNSIIFAFIIEIPDGES